VVTTAAWKFAQLCLLCTVSSYSEAASTAGRDQSQLQHGVVEFFPQDFHTCWKNHKGTLFLLMLCYEIAYLFSSSSLSECRTALRSFFCSQRGEHPDSTAFIILSPTL